MCIDDIRAESSGGFEIGELNSTALLKRSQISKHVYHNIDHKIDHSIANRIDHNIDQNSDHNVAFNVELNIFLIKISHRLKLLGFNY